MKELERLMTIWSLFQREGKIDSKGLASCKKLLQDITSKEWQEGEGKAPEVNKRYQLLLKKIGSQVGATDLTLNEVGVVNLEKQNKNTLFKFLEYVNGLQGEEFVFIFSGTAHIQNVKGNRPIRFALEFQKQGVPVLYSYWRWRTSEPVPDYDGRGLLQIPIDQGMQQIMHIIKAPIHQKHKTFIFEFPYPPASKYLEVFKFYGWKVIYDIRDDWEEFQKVGQARWYQKAHEIYAIEKADCTIAVSKRLTEKFSKVTSKRIELIPNALDSNFTTVNSTKKRTKIGYVGHLSAGWFDWEALSEIAKGLPQYRFEIIGHSMPADIKGLPSNLTYLGPKNFQEVQSYAAEWQVGIIPFKINLLTQAVDPIKVYEYLSMGLKVVSFDMPQILDYPEVKTAHTTREFILKIQEAMKESFDKKKVDEFLQKNTWSKRIEWIRRWHKL